MVRAAAAQDHEGVKRKAWVTTTDGRELIGTMTSFTEAGVVVRRKDGQTLRIPMPDVARIDVPDGLGNGARNGAIAGGVLAGLLVAAVVRECDRDCGGYVAGMAVWGSAIYVGVGAGLGTLIDAANVSRSTLYSKSSSVPVSIAPILAPHAAGVRVSLQWSRR